MHKVWLVFQREYLNRVRKKSFILGTLGIPLLIAVVMSISIYFTIRGDRRPLGYVDLAGVLEATPPPPGEKGVELRPFADPGSARAALLAGDIQGYYVLPPDYLRGGQVQLYYLDRPPGDTARERFEEFLRAGLASRLPAEVAHRAREGVSLIVRSPDGRREFSKEQFMDILMPFVIGFFLFFAIMASGGQLLRSVTDEKENRTLEVMVTTLSPEQLVVGKAFASLAVALTQLLTWMLAAAVALIVGAQFIPQLQEFSVPWDLVAISALFFFPTFTLIGGVMTAIGAAVTEIQQGQQISGVVSMLFAMPFFFSALVFINPNSPVLIALTLLPTTAFMTIALRWATTVIPWWQLAISWLLLIASSGFSIWAAARIFRLGMLRYGQRLDLRSVLQAIRPGSSQDRQKGTKNA